MSGSGDFLGRLAARALGSPPPVRPQLPSRFEAAAPLAEVESPGPHPPAPSPPRPLAGPLPATGRGGERQEARGEETVQARPRMEARPAPLPLPDLVSGPVPFHGPDSVSVNAPAAPPPKDPHPLAPSPTRTPTHPGEGEPPTLAFSVPWVAAPPLPGGVSAGGTEPDPGAGDSIASVVPPAHRSLVPRSTVAREEPDLPFSPSPGGWGGDERGGRGVRSREGDWDGGRGQAPEPTIRVTIGRIEVRATAPAPPPAPAARSTGPRLTLEEYLRRRNEGRM